MGRREFLRRALAFASTTLALTLSRCGLVDDEAVDRSFTSDATEDHTHNLLMTAETLAAPSAQGLAGVTSTEEDHTHNIYITQSQIRDIAAGVVFSIETSTPDTDHEHTFEFNKGSN